MPLPPPVMMTTLSWRSISLDNRSPPTPQSRWALSTNQLDGSAELIKGGRSEQVSAGLDGRNQSTSLWE